MRAVPLLMLAFACQLLPAQEKLLPVFHFNRLTSDDGLPSNEIRSPVVRDHNGYVWVGTVNGLARWDGYGCRVYKNDPSNPHSISSNTIVGLIEDSRKRLWVGTWETGLSLYDAERDRFINFRPRPGDSSWLQARSIYALLEDQTGNLWLGALGGLTHFQLPPASSAIPSDSLPGHVRFTTYLPGTPRNLVRDLKPWGNNGILVATDHGLFISTEVDKGFELRRFSEPSMEPLSTLEIMCCTYDRSGHLWVGTKEMGLFKVNERTGRVENFRHRTGDPTAPSADMIRQLVEDSHGNLWVGTKESIDLFSPATGRRIPYLTYGEAPLGTEDQRLSVDRTGTLWVTTDQSGVYRLSPRSLQLPNYSVAALDGSPRSFGIIERNLDGTFTISSEGKLWRLDVEKRSVLATVDVLKGESTRYGVNDIVTSVLDDHGNLWCGTWGQGLFKVGLADGSVRNYRYQPTMAGYPIVWSTAFDEEGLLWLATYYDGLMQFNPATERFVRAGKVRSLHDTWSVMRDRRGQMWVGDARDGLFVFDGPASEPRRYTHNPSDDRSLSHDRIRGVLEDARGDIWVAAGNALNLWDPSTESFRRSYNPEFIGEVVVTPVGVDQRGRVWLDDLGGGLGIFDPKSGAYRNFDMADGYCGGARDLEKLADDRVLLAGWAGINILHVDSLALFRPAPPLLITRMSINERPVPPPSARPASASLDLEHAQNTLEFGFAALDIDAPDLVRYSYRLEGLEDAWVDPENRRYVRYTAVPPGDYTFRVRAASSREEWPLQEIAVAVSIAPPWWQNPWAYAAYFVALAATLFAGHRLRVRDLRLQQQAEIEHLQAKHLADVDRLKSRFFANISHEFRTPLTLILGPVRKWQERTSDEEQRGDLAMAERNAHRLTRLINQLLDLSKLDAGAMKLKAAPLNLVPLVKGIASSFESSAGVRGIALTVHTDREQIEVYCDKEMLEKILSNLLSNAFKFTSGGGSISVSVRLQQRGAAAGTGTQPTQVTRSPDVFQEGFAEIDVSDTGIGISADEISRVFDRFYQVDASQTREHEGSGIGLALVKELVELHHGMIQVRSEVGQGTTFTVRLPMGRSHLKDDEIVDAPDSVEPTTRGMESALLDKTGRVAPEETEPEQARGERPIVLIVEDNADVRAYIKDYLAPTYQVTEARDGAEGILKAEEIIPDLIISDVMMPKKDGYEVCRILKVGVKTSHIPIILLTAKAASENKIEGLEIGADDYLIKPFEPKELLARVKNLIDLRRKLRQRFNESVPLRPGEIAVTSIDDVFLRKVAAVVEQRMGDENLSVEELGQEVGMSRSQLHRKLTALINQSPSDFIRYMRLHRAMALLQGNVGTVAEVAYTVGFGDPSHFSRRFHEVFGITPGEVRKGPK